MNSFRSVGGWMVRFSAGAALVALAMTAQAAVEKGAAKVLGVRGTAEYSLDGAKWTALKKGETLREGVMLRTASKSGADLDLGRNGARFRLLPNTAVSFSALSFEETGVETIVNTQIQLTAGRVVGAVQKLSSASKYEVKAPKATATVRGTRYAMGVGGDLTVGEGSVMVLSYRDDGTTITRVVNAGEAFSPVSGKVQPATDATLEDVGGDVSSVSGIAALPPLQSRLLDERTALDRTILPVEPQISRPAPDSDQGE